ncbi:hypothetical protein I2W78_27305 [Streptomyces spinoverrucosus]|uniref:hypothetical protein n=1 Tax=Streptomyces spinoverrucosus TaxID=284043 RepID=UPI0018C3F352|nr:hypothetical protein [Streptomyces spinoverrucosus]MBG0855447.1 hypothetical protein [Streptomyces spinoverrucosus]
MSQPPTNPRLRQAAELADHIQESIATLRELDLTGIAPAAVFRAADPVAAAPRGSADATP